MCKALHAQLQISSEQVANLRQELTVETTKNQQMNLSLADLKGALQESRAKVEQQSSETERLTADLRELNAKLESSQLNQ